MLQIKNLSKSYGAKKAVSNLSFVVEDGDIMGFIGKNGAGKTTTLKACLGIIGIDEGEILLDGTSVLKEPLACKQKMAYVPDNPQLDEYLPDIGKGQVVMDSGELVGVLSPRMATNVDARIGVTVTRKARGV